MIISPAKAFFVLVAGTLTWLLALVAFNYGVDPFCLRCRAFRPDQATLNPFYNVGLNLLAQPETQQILLGSSRARTMPVEWFEKKTGLRTVNLATGGAEVFAKLAFIRIARQVTRVASVVWMADYFELLAGIRNDKFLASPAVHDEIASRLPESLPAHWARLLAIGIDHNTIEASFSFMKSRRPYVPSKGGPGLGGCQPIAPEPVSAFLLNALERTNSTYADGILLRPEVPAAWEAFRSEIEALGRAGIRVVVLVPPYHPYFRARLRQNHPDAYLRHEAWLRRLAGLEIPNVRVVSFFSGLPEDGPGTHNWEDGDHFTCRAAVSMLEQSGAF